MLSTLDASHIALTIRSHPFLEMSHTSPKIGTICGNRVGETSDNVIVVDVFVVESLVIKLAHNYSILGKLPAK